MRQKGIEFISESKNMEVEGGFTGDFPDFVCQGRSEDTKSPAANACFDCNICFDVAANPVVTLCGHLYCWSCIYRWLHPTVSTVGDGLRLCPVCKSSLSDSTLIPLYGRRSAATAHYLPGVSRSPVARTAYDRRVPTGQRQRPQNHHFYGAGSRNYMGVLHSTAGVVLGELAFAILPWAFRNQEGLYFQPPPAMVAGSPRSRRQEMIAESWLRQIWVFLVCCAALCWLFF
ncbi:hypothetical protein HPP92_028141 [Vanilla planifolia]|uniref:E3 ubiquitin-protein ligase RMA n=1 Tax=Vanilla planifolia TaxID=51239 RepID=A0A835P902_VANPL|nr:hypothetical protein HPP92_028141 [Vanilla planifolia]KAG0447895.1 hypothetical protein HPP92_028120 [Vanilla planifolia]